MASKFYNGGLAAIMDGTIDLLTDTIKVIAVNPSYVYNADHKFASSVNANELSGTGYTGGFNGSGRKTLASKTVTQDDTNDLAYFDCADWTYTAINAGEIGGFILVKEITNDAASRLIAFVEVADFTTNGNDVTVNVPSNGLLRLKA